VELWYIDLWSICRTKAAASTTHINGGGDGNLHRGGNWDRHGGRDLFLDFNVFWSGHRCGDGVGGWHWGGNRSGDGSVNVLGGWHLHHQIKPAQIDLCIAHIQRICCKKATGYVHASS
jgi:hypothetical protein